MKVVHITTVAVSLRFLTGHIRLLRERQIEVHTISSPAADMADFALRHDVVSHGIEMQRQISPWRDFRSLWQLVKRLRVVRPEIVHAHTPKAGLLGMIAATLTRVPVKVYHLHGLPLMTAGGFKRRLLRWCDKIACRLADQVYCVSPSLAEIVVQEGICAADRLAVLEQGSIGGIDAEDEFNPSRFPADEGLRIRSKLGIPHAAKVVGFVGRIVGDKGVQELLEAWRQLQREFADLHLLIVGPEETADTISDEARTLLANDVRIHCVGFQQETAAYYLAMDVLALPTYREGFGLVATEAAAMGRPVVATRIPGCVDAVEEGETGTLVRPRDAESLANALRYYLSNSELCQQHGRAGRARVVRDFQPSQIEAALWQGYCDCFERKGLPLPTSPELSRQALTRAA